MDPWKYLTGDDLEVDRMIAEDPPKKAMEPAPILHGDQGFVFYQPLQAAVTCEDCGKHKSDCQCPWR